jgi:hypothetical protein
MDEQTLVRAMDPFYTTKKVRRVGLGLPMLAQAAERTGGILKIHSSPGSGTRLRCVFGLRHIDRQPLGDVGGVLSTLIAGNPEVRFIYRHEHDGLTYELDTREIQNELGDLPINHVEVLKFIRKHVREGLREMNSEA